MGLPKVCGGWVPQITPRGPPRVVKKYPRVHLNGRGAAPAPSLRCTAARVVLSRVQPRAPAAPRFTGDLSTCSACSEPLNGPFVRAFGRAFHSRCFKCGLCREVIHDQKYATDNGTRAGRVAGRPSSVTANR